MILRVSWSGLKRYEECHQRHLRTIERKALRPAFQGRDFLAGNVADRTMRAWLSLDEPQPGQMIEISDDYFDRFTNPDREEPDFTPVRWKGNPADDQREAREFIHLVVSRLEPILTKWVLPFDYQPELRFDTVVGVPYLDGRNVALKLIGGIDIVVRDSAGRVVLFDLKATRHDSYIAKTLGQGTFYWLAWKSYWGEYPIRFGFIAPALDNQLVWADIAPEDLATMRSRIVNFAHGMWRGDWTPKADNEGCDFCDVRHACDKFALHTTVDAKGVRRASFDASVEARRAARDYEVENFPT